MPSSPPPPPPRPRTPREGKAAPRHVEESPTHDFESTRSLWTRAGSGSGDTGHVEDTGSLFADEPDEGRGLWFIFTAMVASLGVLVGGIYGLKTVMERGYLDQYAYVFREISLLPSKNIHPAAIEESVQVLESDDGMTLTPRLRRLKRAAAGHEKDLIVIRELTDGEISPGFRPVLPPGTKSRGFYRVGNLAYLDVSGEFLQPVNATPRGERLAVYSLVNSIILNNPEIAGVRLLVDGQPIETAWGWLDCSSALGPDLSLIR